MATSASPTCFRMAESNQAVFLGYASSRSGGTEAAKILRLVIAGRHSEAPAVQTHSTRATRISLTA